MKTCGYIYFQSMYMTECGSKLIFRPSIRCDKCGRKPVEKAEIPNVKTTRESKGETK